MEKTGFHLEEKISYTVSGKGNCLVFLHGFLGSKWVWERYVRSLCQTYLVITIDLPGHGNSSCTKDYYGMNQIADLVMEILHHENIEQCHLIGHSMGGYVSLALGKKHSQFVQSITLINSNIRADNEQKRKERTLAARVFDMNPNIFLDAAMNHLFLSPSDSSIEEIKNKVISIAHSTSKKGAKACLLGIRDREDLQEWYVHSSTPILYLSSINDTTIPFEIIKDQVAVGNFNLVTLNQSNHMSMMEEFEMCLSSMEFFLKKQA